MNMDIVIAATKHNTKFNPNHHNRSLFQYISSMV